RLATPAEAPHLPWAPPRQPRPRSAPPLSSSGSDRPHARSIAAEQDDQLVILAGDRAAEAKLGGKTPSQRLARRRVDDQAGRADFSGVADVDQPPAAAEQHVAGARRETLAARSVQQADVRPC